MSYTSKNRYKTRREKAQIINKNARRVLIFLAIAFVVWLIKYRELIVDRMGEWFY